MRALFKMKGGVFSFTESKKMVAL